ncbi:MAG: MBL fold metallo-hydrolase [Gammaproteobacteria bacterium]|nr:MBL fold metallo-hydrolase [Gammaproteobacteria bacterium]
MKNIFVRIIKWIFFIVVLSSTAMAVFINLSPTFGGSPDDESLNNITQSKHHNGDIFINKMATEVLTLSEDSPSMLEAFSGMFFFADDKNPTQPLPAKKLNKAALKEGSFTWLGHSTVLFKTSGKVFMTDPVFHSAAPLQFIAQPFLVSESTTMDDLPTIDAILISHDHYDHLDYEAIKVLDAKTKHYYVPLGVKAHLQRWGVDDKKITELDWYETVNNEEVAITLTPARHFSGRGIFDRYSTLWGSWVIKSPNVNVYFSGDGGYSPEFKTIGNTYGPFDIAFMENGAYDKDWSQIHLMPEEAVQAAIDLRAAVLLPIHWGKFDLARHTWRDPIQRMTKEAERKGIDVATPIIGKSFTLNLFPKNDWWSQLGQIMSHEPQ